MTHDTLLRSRGLRRRSQLTAAAVFGILVAGGAAIVIMSAQLGTGSFTAPGPGLFPAAAGALLAFAAAATLVQRLRLPRTSGEPGGELDAAGDGEQQANEVSPPVKILTVICVPLLYVLSADILGHLVATAVGAAAVVRVLGRRSWVGSLVTGLAIGLGSQLLLSRVLGVGLPAGWLDVFGF